MPRRGRKRIKHGSLTPIMPPGPALGGDPFGLQREQMIMQSGARDVFTPHQPISQVELLFGRRSELQSIIETLNTPGQHVLLYGDRGVGKSSLATVVSVLVRSTGRAVLVKRCDTSDKFGTIIRPALAQVDAIFEPAEISASSDDSRSGSLGRSGLVITAGTTNGQVTKFRLNEKLSPSAVAEATADVPALLLIDEADAIVDTEDRRKLAELIKLLSDAGSMLKIMVVGIADTSAELTAAHPSVQRCLKETKLRRLSNGELEQIIVNGGDRLGLKFTSNVIRSIVSMSAGYPYFTHLICLRCAESAVVAGRSTVGQEQLAASLTVAVADAESTLKRVYGDAVRSASPMYRVLLNAAAKLGDEFSSAEWRGAVESITQEAITQGALNNYFARLVSTDGSTVLRRTGQGYYRFEDPRMPSYVRMNAGAAGLP